MAFQTITGESGVDFIGTDGVDVLFSLNDAGKKTVDAKGGNDVVDLTNETGVVGTAEVKLGAGNDTLTMGGNDTGNNRLANSTVNGGPGDDNITTEGAVSTKIRGNEDDDDFTLSTNYTATTLNGNSGEDSFTLGAATQFSNSKVIGGSGNDGQMDFSGADMLAVDSVIQGGKGLDTITIGALTTGTTGFRVTGGADNDTLNVGNTNADVDGVAYNGAAGDDAINFLAANAGDATTKGGEGDDRFTIDGSGKISALGEDGNDTFVLAAGHSAESTVNGAAGADTYTFTTPEKITFVISSVSESAAATTGTAVTFDTFTTSVNNTLNDDVIDMTGGSATELVGNRLNADEVLINAGVTVATAASFAAVKSALDGTLTASDSNVGGTNTGRISLQLIEVTAGAVAGFYAILNNTNTIIDSGDMMFDLAATTAAAGAAEIVQIHDAIEAGF